MRQVYDTKLHDNGNVTYWSVYDQVWTTDPAYAVPDRELAAMSAEERRAVEAHAKAHPMNEDDE